MCRTMQGKAGGAGKGGIGTVFMGYHKRAGRVHEQNVFALEHHLVQIPAREPKIRPGRFQWRQKQSKLTQKRTR